jgi:hypothetical protein
MRTGPPHDHRGRYIRFWRYRHEDEKHFYDRKGPYLSIYSSLEAHCSNYKAHWGNCCYYITHPKDGYERHHKYERNTSKPVPAYTERPLDDWFEPGTPRQ